VDTDGIWGLASNWDLSRIPTLGDDVVISRVAGVYTITHSSGSTSIDSLLCDENLTLSGGVLSLMNAGKTNRLNGSFLWTVGTVGGVGTLETHGSTEISGASAKQIDGSVRNHGSTVIRGTSSLRGSTGAVYENTVGAWFDLDGDGTPLNSITAGTQPVFSNAGAFRKTSGAGTSIVDFVFNNSGTVDAQTGTIRFDRGGQLGGTYTGAGVNSLSSGTFDLADRTVVVSSGTLKLTGSGKIVGSGGWISGSTFVWESGSIEGTVGIDTASAAEISGSSAKNLAASSTVRNKGTIVVVGSSFIYGSTSGLVENLAGGLIDLQGDGTPFNSTTSGIQPRLSNDGILRKSAGTGTSIVDFGFRNTGVVDVRTGTLRFARAFESYSAGTLLEGTYLLSGVMRFQNTGISTNDAWVFLQAPGAGIENISGVNSLTNLATNNGILSLNDHTLSIGNALANTGSVRLGTSASLTVSGAYTQTLGSTELYGGALTATGGVNILGGVLMGSGTINGNVLNSGTVAPGQSPGVIEIIGDYVQDTGALNVQLGGTTPELYDRLIVDGDVSLSGYLQVFLMPGFAVNAGDSFKVLEWTGIRTGSFDTFVDPYGVFERVWGEHDLTLVALSSTVPEPSAVLVLSSALLAVAGMRRRARR